MPLVDSMGTGIYQESAVLLTTLGNIPVVMPRYYCRERSHDNATVFGWYCWYSFKSHKPMTS